MASARARLDEIEAGLRAGAASPRDLVLAGAEPVVFRHYPDGDLYDRVSGGQAYFHVHDRDGGGHFHLFLRRRALPGDVRPLAGPDGAPTHLGALELDDGGWPAALFATNRWVTGEAWYRADDLIAALPAFTLVLAEPWRRLGLWLTALVDARRDDFAELLRRRDAVMAMAAADDFDDPGREVLVRLPLQ